MIGTLLFVIFMFPIIYVLLNQKFNGTKLKREFNKIAAAHNLQLDTFETIGHLSLGLDSLNKKLVIIDPTINKENEVIDLTKINQVRILQNTLREATRKERIVHIGLELVDPSMSKITEIVFYDEDDYESTDAEIRLHNARKWDHLLQKNLAS